MSEIRDRLLECLREGRVKELEQLRRRGELSHLDLSRADLTGLDLYDAHLQEGDLYRAVLARADLRRARLRDCMLYGVDGRSARLDSADLGYAILNLAAFVEASFESANLRQVRAVRADFSGSSFRLAKMTGADLRQARFRDGDLSHADFTDADLRFADLRGACLDGAIWRRARLEGCRVSASLPIDYEFTGAMGGPDREEN